MLKFAQFLSDQSSVMKTNYLLAASSKVCEHQFHHVEDKD